MNITDKLSKLNKILSKLKRVLVAFSGGVDSTFLLASAVKALGKNNVLAVTALSDTYQRKELKRVKNLVKKLGVSNIFIKTNELNNKNFLENSKKRCYYCKNELFRKLADIARENNITTLCDGSNYSDRTDFRPGTIAAKKWRVVSPLLLCGLTKLEIRQLSKRMGLSTWDLPAQACLASRFPYGAKISRDALKKIDKAETLIKTTGISCVRLRHHGEIARIEIGKNELKRFINSSKLENIIACLKNMGWKYIAIDAEGYRTGSLN